MDKQLTTAGREGPQELKQQIYTQLKKAGVVSSLKSQLRTQLFDQLRKLAGPDAVKATAAAGPDQQARSMWHSAVNSIITEYLQSCGCQFTLSVFKSEAELTEQPAFSVGELCQLMRLDRHPQLLERVQQLLQTEGCLALALLQALSASGGATTVDSGCQTSSAGQIEGLGKRLLQLEDSYMAKASQKQGSVSRVTLEEQMAAYKQECDALLEVQVAARVARIKEVELAAARQEAAAKYRQQLELDRAELERIHADRLARLAAREDEVTEKLRRQQRDVESIAYTQRQRILGEEERIRSMKAEVSRQLEVQEQLLKGLEAQLKEREKAVAARETTAESKLAKAAELETKLAAAARKHAAAELAEEQAALRGERTALEAERARVSELRQAVNADLAVSRAKEDRLRTLESARAEAEACSAAHAAGEEVLRLQLKHLQAEVAALQQELVHAGAAAGAAAAAAGQQQLYPAGEAGVAASAAAAVLGGGLGPVQLPQALRELGQLQRLAQETQLALDEAVVERDNAVSRSEELTISLNAARREITALRSQVARQQQDIIQLKLQLGQANAASVAAAASGRNTALGFRGSIGSLKGISPADLHTSSPPRGLGGLGLGQSSLAAPSRAASAASPVAGLRSRAFTTGGLNGTWGSGAVGARGLLGQVVSAGGADELQAAAARIAQLTAADASMSQRIADLRRRSAAQRAAAARQLADLKAVAGSSVGGAGSSLGGVAGGAAGFSTAQRDQPRLSIPSEYDNLELEVDVGIDDQSAEELQQQQQRREALELALQPPAGTAAQLSIAAAMTAAGARPYSSSCKHGVTATAGEYTEAAALRAAAAGVYRLDDVLRLAGSLRASVDSQQAQQQQQQQQQLGVDIHQQQQPQEAAAKSLRSSAAGLPARPHSTITELSFVEQLQQQGIVEDSADSQATNSSSVLHLQQQEQSAAEEPAHRNSTSSHVQQVMQTAQPTAAGSTPLDTGAAEPGPTAKRVSNMSSAAIEQQEKRRGQQPQLDGAMRSRSGAQALAAVVAAVGEADAASTTAAELDTGDAVQPPVDQHAVMAQPSQLQQDPQYPSSTAQQPSVFAPDDSAAQIAAVAEEATTDADAIDEGVDLADDLMAELSALSSAVAREAAAAVEGARLSRSSAGMTGSGIGLDRYSSNKGGGYDTDDEDLAEDHQRPDTASDLDYDTGLEAPGQQQQLVTATYNQLQESAGSWAYSAADSPQQQQQQQGVSQAREPAQASPGWSEARASLGGVWEHQGASYHTDDEDEDAEVSGGRGRGASDYAGMVQQLQSPPSSEGSVF